MDASIRSVLDTSEKHPTPGYDYDPESQLLTIHMQKTASLDPALPLAVGDCVHNARSALDHLAFQLAILNGTGSSAASEISFPVYLTAGKFKKATEHKVAPFISGAALAEIEKYQPYAPGNAGKDDVLYVLTRLDNIDKHRLVLVTASKFMPVDFLVTVPNGAQFRHQISHKQAGEWKDAKDGAEIIRFDLSEAITVPGKVRVKLGTVAAVLIEQTGLICDGYAVQNILNDCIQHVASIVDGFDRKFFGEFS